MYRDGEGFNEDKVTTLVWFEIFLANKFKLKNVARECMNSNYKDCGY